MQSVCHKYGGLGGNAFAAPGESEPFGSGGFYRNAVGGEVEVGGYVLDHPGDVVQQFWFLGNDGDVDVDRTEALVGGEARAFAQKNA